MDLTLLDTLRYKIVTGKVFADVWTYFLDHFGEDAEFIALGEPADDEMLLKLLGQLGGDIFNTDVVRLDNMRLIHIPEYHFIHGNMIINGKMANVIYCDDLLKGILMVHRFSRDQPTLLSRFSANMLAPNLAAEATKFRQ